MGVYTDKKTGGLFIQFDYQCETYKFRLPKGTTEKQAEKLEVKKKNKLFFESHGISDQAPTDTLFEVFLAEVYLPFVKANRCENTYDQCVRVCKDSLQFFKGRGLRSFRRADIEKFKAHRMQLPKYDFKKEAYCGEKRAASTIVKEISHISMMFEMAIDNEVCDSNPCRRVEKPEFDNVQDLILSEKDEVSLFAKFQSDWARDVCKVILNTGLRQNDILGLTKFQVDWQTADIVLVQGKVKRRVRIPMNDTVQAIVREWCEKHPESEFVFPSPKTGGRGGSVQTALEGACVRAEIGLIGTRVLRRTFGTRLHEKGYDDMTVAGLLGHRDLRSVHRYKRGTVIKRTAVNDLETPKKATKKVARKAAPEKKSAITLPPRVTATPRAAVSR
jgi:site-specific recombinase XerD